MKVSVIMITYSHEKYITDAIMGVVNQKCNFEIELIIANDNSPDDTDLIIKKIDFKKYSNVTVKYLKREINLGIMPNFIDALKRASGDYIALCDGDDYWIDSFKLQKQITFLENNKDFSLCAHNALVKYEDSNVKEHLFNSLTRSQELLSEMVINKWIMPTASMIFRREVVDDLPDWLMDIYCGDYPLALLSMNKGRMYFMDENMSVYRVILKGGSFSSSYKRKVLFVFEQHLKLMKLFNEFSNKKFEVIINNKIKRLNSEILFFRNRQVSNLNAFFKQPFFFVQKLKEKILS